LLVLLFRIRRTSKYSENSLFLVTSFHHGLSHVDSSAASQAAFAETGDGFHRFGPSRGQ
jgi:hypothetical protein